jgi:regulatory protein
VSIDAAKGLVVRVLAYHARTEAQLRARLAKDGHAEHADEVIAWLRRLGYLDDAAYARGHARALLARHGPRLVERRLRAAGVDAAEAAAVVASAVQERAGELAPAAAGAGAEAAELALCRAALARKLRGADPAGLDLRARARAARFLLGRGFSGRVVAQAVGDLGMALEG